MFQVTVKQVGNTFHAETVHAIGMAKTPVSACKTIAKMLCEGTTRHAIVIATLGGYAIEYTDFLIYRGECIFILNISKKGV